MKSSIYVLLIFVLLCSTVSAGSVVNTGPDEKENRHIISHFIPSARAAGFGESQIKYWVSIIKSTSIDPKITAVSLSRIINSIEASVTFGGDGIKLYATFINKSPQELDDLWANDPSKTLSLVAKGISFASGKGGSLSPLYKAFDALGLNRYRAVRVLCAVNNIIKQQDKK